MAKIAPSILSADFANLERDIRNIAENGGDWNTGSAMSMVLIFITAGIYLVYRRVGGKDLGVF